MEALLCAVYNLHNRPQLTTSNQSLHSIHNHYN